MTQIKSAIPPVIRRETKVLPAVADDLISPSSSVSPNTSFNFILISTKARTEIPRAQDAKRAKERESRLKLTREQMK